MCVERVRETAEILSTHAPRSTLVLVGSGAYEASYFVAKNELKMFSKKKQKTKTERFLAHNTELVDASTETYRLWGLERGVGATLTLTRIQNLIGLLKYPFELLYRGQMNRVGPFRGSLGDPLLQGAIFVLNADGSLIYSAKEVYPGYPRLNAFEIKNALKRADKSELPHDASPLPVPEKPTVSSLTRNAILVVLLGVLIAVIFFK